VFFLASLIFVLMLYVIPGILALNLGAGAMHDLLPLPAAGWLFIFCGLVYVAALVAVKVGRWHLHEWVDENEERQRVLEQIFDVSRCAWINLVGLVLIGIGAGFLALRMDLPYQVWPLFAAALFGLGDLFHRSTLVPLPNELPAVQFEEATFGFDTEDQKDRPADVKTVKVKWSLEGESGKKTFERDFSVSNAEYHKAHEQQRLPRDRKGYVTYVEDGGVDDLKQIAKAFRDMSKEAKLSSIEEVQNVVSMVRELPAAVDQADYVRFPIETVYDYASDAEDRAILAACLLVLLGHKVALFHLKLKNGEHLALGYHRSDRLVGGGGFSAKADDGQAYDYVETLPEDSEVELGAISEEFSQAIKKAEVWPVG